MTNNILTRNNVKILGLDKGPVVVLSQGFGCDGGTWEKMLPYFTDNYRVVTFDHVGTGDSDLTAYDSVKYAKLDGYAGDLLEICQALNLHDVTFVAHSFGAMMAITAAAAHPEYFGRLVLLASSPSYLDRPEDNYTGGFVAGDVTELIASLDTNYLVWAAAAVMGTPETPENAVELEESFRRFNPVVAREYARACFLADVRHLLRDIAAPTLILQCSNDLLVPSHIGAYLQENLANSTLVQLAATGHCPHLSFPRETSDAILTYLEAPAAAVEPERGTA